MQFMILSRRRTEDHPPSDFDALIPDETNRIRELYAAGIVRQIWHRTDIPGACFLLESEDQEAAQAIIDSLPMASSGLSEFTIHPLAPYRGFAN